MIVWRLVTVLYCTAVYSYSSQPFIELSRGSLLHSELHYPGNGWPLCQLISLVPALTGFFIIISQQDLPLEHWTTTEYECRAQIGQDTLIVVLNTEGH